MDNLYRRYHPITAAPFRNNESYCEIEPCDALKPYIRCFWGTAMPLQGCVAEPDIVIPDTCMDIIFYINYTKNCWYGKFCGIDEKAYRINGGIDTGIVSTFAIRFYPWSAFLFTENSLRDSKNTSYEVNDYFNKLRTELESMLFDAASLVRKAEIAEYYLLKQLHPERRNDNLFNALSYIIASNGTMKISELSMRTAVSKKQLERIFHENIGVSPKTLSSLIRYQLLWQDMVYGKNFNVLDAVDKYDYFDQAHLLNDFKRHHLISTKEALEFARKK